MMGSLSLLDSVEWIAALSGFYGFERVTIVNPGDERHGDIEHVRFVTVPFSTWRRVIDRQVVDFDADAPDEYPEWVQEEVLND